MTSQVRIEARKTTSGLLWPILILVLVIMMLGVPSTVAANIAQEFAAGPDALEAGERLPNSVIGYLFSFAGRTGYFAAFLLGALSMAGEFGQRTISRTLVLGESRSTVYVGKAVAVALAAALLGIIATAVNAGAVTVVVSAQGRPSGLAGPEVWGILTRTPVAFALWGLIGVGLGALIRNQIAAVSVVFAFFLFIEPTLTMLSNENESVRAFGRFLPGSANWSLVWPPLASSETVGAFAQSSAVLGWVSGGAVLVAYATALLLAGYLIGLRRRDITA